MSFKILASDQPPNSLIPFALIHHSADYSLRSLQTVNRLAIPQDIVDSKYGTLLPSGLLVQQACNSEYIALTIVHSFSQPAFPIRPVAATGAVERASDAR